jgi:hypothetical protein
MSMTLTADVDDSTTSLPVSEDPPAWLIFPLWASLATASPARFARPFEFVYVLGYEAGALTVERGGYYRVGDPNGGADFGAAPHAAGTEVVLGFPPSELPVEINPYPFALMAKIENRRLARMQRRAGA